MRKNQKKAPPEPQDPHADDCASCGEGLEKDDCPASKLDCGHHCNCSWEQDECCWCGEVFDEIEE